jgi:hypothetical protein
VPVISRLPLRRSAQAAMPHFQGFISFKSRAKRFNKEQAAIAAR